MGKAPAWVVPLVEHLCGRPAETVLWVGPDLGLSGLPDWSVTDDVHGAQGGPFACVCIASVEGDLAVCLRSVRPHCEPGATVCLLLPEQLPGVGAKVARVFDPMGRAGRRPRSLAEMCGALLAIGAEGVGVLRDDGQLRGVYARIPEHRSVLDAAFEESAHATT